MNFDIMKKQHLVVIARSAYKLFTHLTDVINKPAETRALDGDAWQAKVLMADFFLAVQRAQASVKEPIAP